MESGLGSNPRSPTSPRYSLGASGVWALFTVVQKTGPSSHGPCVLSDDREEHESRQNIFRQHERPEREKQQRSVVIGGGLWVIGRDDGFWLGPE